MGLLPARTIQDSVSAPLSESADTKPQRSEGAEVTEIRSTIQGTGYLSLTLYRTEDRGAALVAVSGTDWHT